jgi:hypothetical protein
MSYKKYVVYVLNKMMESKTPFCRHDSRTCVENIIRSILDNFKGALILRSGFALFFAFLKHRLKFWKHLGHLLSMDTIKFMAFTGSLTAIFKFFLCFFRTFRNKDEKWHAAVAGFISGLTLIIDIPRRRNFISTFIYIRVVDLVMSLLDQNNIVHKVKHGEVYVFYVIATFLVYMFYYEYEGFPQGAQKIFLHAWGDYKNDHRMVDIARRINSKWFPHLSLKFKPCSIHD